jgi:hypothetical protein
MSSIRRIVSLAMVLPGLVASFNASAEEAAQGWQHTLFIYGMGAALDGTAEIGIVKVTVDLSASDVLDALEFGAMAAYRADNGTWSFTGDATFMGLGGSDTTEGGRVKGEIDVDQLTLMGTVGRRWTNHLEFLFGLAYVDLSADLEVTGQLLNLKASRDADWIDPTIGLQYNRPIGDDWRVNLRGDIGGFGIGSDFMYHLLASARWQASETVGVFFGYRLISFDYEEGSGRDYQHYDLTEQGPLVGVSFSF